MPELEIDVPALGMDGPGDLLPTRDLCLGVDARSVRVTVSAGRDRGRLRDDQSRRGALGVIEGIEVVRHMTPGGPASGERRHEDPVWKVKRSQEEGGKQVGLVHKRGMIRVFLSRWDCLFKQAVIRLLSIRR
jgi:hypothetical protein